MKKSIYTILSSWVLVILTCLPAGRVLPVLAVTSTPSATPTALNLQDKIKTIVKDNLTATEKVLEGQTSSKIIGRTGTIKSIGAKNITLEIEKDITQINMEKSDTKASSLAIGNKIMVFGKMDKDNVIMASRIIPVEEKKAEELVETTAILAKITKIDLKKKTFVLTVDSKTFDYTLSKKTTVKLDDLTDGDTLFAISKKYQGKYSLSRATKI